MKIFLCTGHADYGNGIISSADGSAKGGCNEFLYNKELIKSLARWLELGGCDVNVCVPPTGQLHCLNDEVNYYIGNENKADYDLSIQLHLNSFNGIANGCEVWYYSDKETSDRIVNKLGTIWNNRGSKKSTSLYWLKKTKAKALLIESFFCDNSTDYKLAKKLGYDNHAKLIAEGILNKKLTDSKSYLVTAEKKVGEKNDSEILVEKLTDLGCTVKVKEI